MRRRALASVAPVIVVAAITGVRAQGPAPLGDASFLAALVPSAVKVTLGDGEKKIQDLRIGG